MIFTNIDEDIKNAMKNKDQVALKAIRAIKSALLLLKADASVQEITEEDELKLINRLVKQRKESFEIYQSKGRDDLAQEEMSELIVLQKYLPKQLSEEEIKTELKKIIVDIGAKDQSSVGKVMQAAMKVLSGKADGKTINRIAKELLN